jgi:hypothetical protein
MPIVLEPGHRGGIALVAEAGMDDQLGQWDASTAKWDGWMAGKMDGMDGSRAKLFLRQRFHESQIPRSVISEASPRRPGKTPQSELHRDLIELLMMMRMMRMMIQVVGGHGRASVRSVSNVTVRGAAALVVTAWTGPYPQKQGLSLLR